MDLQAILDLNNYPRNLSWKRENLMIKRFNNQRYITLGIKEEVIVLSGFFLFIFIRTFKFFLAMMFIFVLIKLGFLVVN